MYHQKAKSSDGCSDGLFLLYYCKTLTITPGDYEKITIINPYGWTIYNDVVNTAVQQVLVVPISFTAEGIYTIILDNADDYAEGDFVKD